jgi:anti-sigma factor RsiW
MKHNPLEQELREIAWRRPLTAGERARLAALLAANPQSRAEWEADAALGEALARLPEKPAPSNLAARVLAEIEREGSVTAKARQMSWWGWLSAWGWVPRLAVVVGLTVGGAFYLHRQQQVKTAHALAAVTRATPLPATEDLEDFDSIYALPPPFPGADEELIALMK